VPDRPGWLSRWRWGVEGAASSWWSATRRSPPPILPPPLAPGRGPEWRIIDPPTSSSAAPDVLEAMLKAGAWENDLAARLIGGEAQPGDEDLVAVQCRRPFLECVLRRAVENVPGVTVMSGTRVEALNLRRDGGRFRVTGVRWPGGGMDAGLVIDAGGRASPLRGFVRRAGASIPDARQEPCGLIYYSRYFRLRPGAGYPGWTGALGPSGTTDWARFSLFFGDNRTFAIVLGVPASDRALRGLAREDGYTRAVSRFGSLAPFIDPHLADPITGVVAFGSLADVFHPALQDGRPPVLGLHFLGDSYCHTNPLFAWGLCLALDYGFRLGRIIDDHPDDPEAQALAFAAATEIEAEQCFQAVAEEDRDRTQTWEGRRPSGPWLGRTFAGFVRECAQPAVPVDPVVARAVLRRSQLLDLPDEMKGRPELVRRIESLQPELPKPLAGSSPTRAEMVEILRSSGPGGQSVRTPTLPGAR
jgi:2-polyprenyl-6-methoxyphenol hydroxylase-like FAD-dependent oxidoreductase